MMRGMGLRPFVVMAVCGGALLACPPAVDPPPDAGTPPPPCAAGQVPSDAGRGCMAALPEQCDAGTMALPGNEACVPVGHLDCQPPLVPHASGWGCDWPLPSCDAGVALMDGGCGWPGDCSAAFPPPAATHFVDAAFDAGQLDATHFSKPSDALAAAPAGAVIAVERGTYVDTVRFTKTGQQLVGRCAAEVVLQSPGGSAGGFELYSAVTATVQGVRARAHRGGAVVVAGHLTLVDSVLDQSREIGAMVVTGGRLSMLRSAVRSTASASNGALGRGINIEAGGQVDLTESTVEDSGEVGIFVQEQGSRLTLTRSAVLGTRGDGAGAGGRGVTVRLGATATFLGALVRGVRDMGMFIIGSEATLSQVVVRDVARQPNGQFGRGISFQPGARGSLTGVTVRDAHDTGVELLGPGTLVSAQGVTVHRVGTSAAGEYGMAVFVRDAARLDGRSLAAVSLGSSGIAASGPGFLQLEEVLVRDVEGDANGIYGFGFLLAEGAGAVVSKASIGPVRSAGIITSDLGAFINLSGALIDDVRSERASGGFGQGVVGLPDSRIELTDTVLRRAAVTGAAFAGAGGKLTRCELRAMPVGLHVQLGSALQIGDAPGVPAATDVWVDEATAFLGVVSNVGAGNVPLPDPSGIR